MSNFQDKAITALLCEQVYRRDTEDAEITDQDIASILSVSKPTAFTGFQGSLGDKYSITPDGYVYAVDTNDGEGVDNGFVARVVRSGNTYYVTFRGSDLSDDFVDFSFDNAAAAVAAGGLDSIHKHGEVDDGAFQSSNPDLDYADWYWNGAHGVGTIDQNAQIFSALEITNAVRNAVGSDSNIVVTGQSLGGGLAGIVGAVTGLKAITYAAAPFKNQISEIARLNASQFIIENNDDTFFTAEFNALSHHQKQVVLYYYFEDVPSFHSSHLQFYDSSQSPSKILPELVFNFTSPAEAGLIASVYQSKFEEFNSNYESNVLENQTSLRVDGEVLSNGPAQTVFGLAGQYIKADDGLYNFGPDTGWYGDASGVSTGLHSPTLHAIAALTNESSDRNFANLYSSDQAFWDAMLVNTGIAGAQDHERADDENVSSKLPETGPSVGILHRVLMKTISVDSSGSNISHDGDFYDYFYEVYGEKLRLGIAADGLKEATGDAGGSNELSLHAGLVEIGLQVLRDAVEDYSSVEQFKENLSDALGITDENKKHYFAGDIEQAVSFNKAAINTERSGEHSEKFVEILSNGDKRAFGVSDIEYELVKQIVAGDTNNISDYVFKDALGDWFHGVQHISELGFDIELLQPDVEAGQIRLKLDWEIIVAQAGSDAAGLDFDAKTAHTISQSWGEKSHFVFGGEGYNKVTATDSSDIVVGRDGGNKILGGAGNDLLIGGTGKDEFEGEEGNDLLIGGGDDDTFKGSEGSDLIFGGDLASELQGGVDKVDFSEINKSLSVSFAQEDGSSLRNVTVTGEEINSKMYSVDELILSDVDDTVVVDDLELAEQEYGLVIDAGDQEVVDTLDFSGLAEGVNLQMLDAGSALVDGIDLTIKNFENLILTGFDDVVYYATASDENSDQLRGSLQTGAGEDVIYIINSADPNSTQTLEEERAELTIDAGDHADIVIVEGAATIHLGDGKDVLHSAGVGSVVYTGAGGINDGDAINMTNTRGSLIADADGHDQVFAYGYKSIGNTYKKHADSESDYFYGMGGHLKLAINSAGELVVGDAQSKDNELDSFLYLANFKQQPACKSIGPNSWGSAW